MFNQVQSRCSAIFNGKSGYSFGFNGKENDAETGTQDYGFRIYNPALGKFLSVDPLTKDYPWYTPYQFAGNKPIWAVDVDGKEEFYVTDYVNAAGQLYKTEIHLVSNIQTNGRQNSSQVVHRSQVTFNAAGNAAVTYLGSSQGVWSATNAGPFASLAEGQTALTGPAPARNAAGNWVTTSIGTIPPLQGQTPNSGINVSSYPIPEYQTIISTPDPTQPNNVNAPGVTPILGTNSEVGAYQVINFLGVAAPPSTSAYVAPGTNAVPQNMRLRFNIANPAGSPLDQGRMNISSAPTNTPYSPAMGALAAPAPGTAAAPTQTLNVGTQQDQSNPNPPAPANTVTIF